MLAEDAGKMSRVDAGRRATVVYLPRISRRSGNLSKRTILAGGASGIDPGMETQLDTGRSTGTLTGIGGEIRPPRGGKKNREGCRGEGAFRPSLRRGRVRSG